MRSLRGSVMPTIHSLLTKLSDGTLSPPERNELADLLEPITRDESLPWDERGIALLLRAALVSRGQARKVGHVT